MKKNIGRIFNNRIVAGDKNIISKGEGFVSKESVVFIRTDNGFEGKNPEPPVPPVPTNRILYTVVEGGTKPTSTWITENCSDNVFDTETGEGYLVLNEGVTTLEGEYTEEPEELEYTIFKDYSGEDWEDDNIKSIVIPSQITSIGEYAFGSYTGLTSVTIPNSVTSIGYSVFGGCTGLTSVIIPNLVTTIGGRAFDGCKSLASVTCFATTPPTLGGSAFANINTTTCAVPAGCVATYEASNWANYFTTFTEIQ